MIFSDKSSGSTVLLRELDKHSETNIIEKTRHFASETLYWNKAAALLGMSQAEIEYSELPISKAKVKTDLEKLLKDNLDSFDVSKRMGFQSMAYDFLVNENQEPEFCEVSYTYVSRAVYNCPGYWDAKLNYHKGHWWPEHLHLIDALGLPDLKMPEWK